FTYTCSEPVWKETPVLSENATQCLTYAGQSSKWNTTLYRQWKRIFSEPSLQITSLILWMRGNLSLLSQPEFFQPIEIALFTPGLLTKKIQEEPLILDQLRGLFHDAITYYSHTSVNNPTSLFLLRLAIALESYVSEPCLKTLSYYEAEMLNC